VTVDAFNKSSTDNAFDQSDLPNRPLLRQGFALHLKLSRRIDDDEVFQIFETRQLTTLYELLPGLSDQAALAVLFSQYTYQQRILNDPKSLPPFIRVTPELTQYAREYIAAVDALDPQIGVFAKDLQDASLNPASASGEVAQVFFVRQYDDLKNAYRVANDMITTGINFTDIEYFQRDLEAFKSLPSMDDELERARTVLVQDIERDIPKFQAFWNGLTPETDADAIEQDGYKITGLRRLAEATGEDFDEIKPPKPTVH